MATATTFLDLPVDILYLVFPYLDIPSFVALTSTCKALYDSEFSEHALYWSSVTRSTFRVPNQPVVEGNGKRWKRMCKRMLTQSRVYTWGNNEMACLGHSQVAPGQLDTLGPGIRRRVVMRSRHVSLPTELRNVARDYGVVADMQCGGWSTTFLTSKGVLYSVGVMDGLPHNQHPKVNPEELRYPAGFPPPSQRYTPATAVKQFSAGRAHILALSDSCRIWSWNNIAQTALHVKFLTVEMKETTKETEIGHVKKVVAGWNKSAALVVGTGIVIWDSLSRGPHEPESEEDGALVLETAVVPRTNFERTQGNALFPMLSGTRLDAEVGEVQNLIVLEHYVVFSTHLGKIFASKILWSEEEQRVTEALEIPINDNDRESAALEESDEQFATDIQGSFQRFAIFTRSGAVLTSNQDHLDRFLASPQNKMYFQRIPALQNTSVMSIAFGDYHFHALHSPGYITSYGSEPRGCGCLGLGGHGDPEGRLRGLRYQGIGGDGRLVPHAYTSGRRIWFEEEKRRWITFLTSGAKDPEEARDRIRMCADVNVQGEVSEWVEQEGRAWEERFGGSGATKTDDDGLATHFVLSVTAAGWHSGALVLVNEEEADRIREGCIVRPPEPPQPFDEGNKEEDVETTNRGFLDRTLDRAADHARWFLGLPTAAEEQRAADSQPNHIRPFTIPVNHGAETEDGHKYAWADDSFPRLKLSDGREMPGTIEFHEWRNQRPEWDLTTQY